MRILVVQESDWIEKGPHQSHHLMERLAGMGHEVIVIDFEIEWKRRPRGQLLSKRLIRFGLNKTGNGGTVTLIRPPFIKVPILDYVSLIITHGIEIRRQIRAFRPDVIVGFGILNARIAAKLASDSMIPFVYYVIDELHRLVPERLLRGIARGIETSTLTAADRVITINEELRNYTVRMGANESRVAVVRAGVDVSWIDSFQDREGARRRLGIREGACVLFFMGWLYSFSGLEEVARAIVGDNDRYDGFQLLVVGSGDLAGTLDAISASPASKGKIQLFGWQPYGEIPMFLAASDICILPAHMNPLMMSIVPIKIYEYMAACKPVISTRLPGVVREFGNGNGVVYVDQPEGVVEKALQMTTDGTILEEGQRARRFAERNDWNSVTSTFEAILISMTHSQVGSE